MADQTATDSEPSIVDFYYTVQLYGDWLLLTGLKRHNGKD